MKAEPCTYVIFGATGNLSRIKLMPALYRLDAAGRLPEGTRIMAMGRRPWDQQKWRQEVQDMVQAKAKDDFDEAVFQRFSDRLYYHQGDISQADCYSGLAGTLADKAFSQNIAFYLSISPADFGPVMSMLSTNDLFNEESGWRRVIIEKPFGYDLESAQALQKRISHYLSEEQIYRIDHYLGKGMVQNVLVFRFANVMLEPLWNRNYIDHIQITHSESIGIDSRGDYYDGAGALRDMLQSHLLQLLTLVTMEPPVSMEAESLRDEKVKVLKSIRPISKEAVHAQAFRGQYAKGMVNNEKVKGYLDEANIPQSSTTETYASMKLYIDNWRWRGVPFYMRTGKRMAKAQSTISICFRHPPLQFFRDTNVQCMNPNWVLLGIQPEECIRIEMTVKEPGLEMSTRTSSLDASFRNQDEKAVDAYEDLLLDVLKGDRSLFLRFDEVEYAWRIVDPILQSWAVERDYIATYPAGSWGPEDSRLFDKESQSWRSSLTPECK
ncbi:glucose-6-phosphate dehydrogenase [Methylovulum psychrotolerans]|uniref:Glucose-6-phosphate 1-dehydrogenase n=1 Tax=Methylovulum psychrotolerans TaxID=1704499 RepID=A0A1Z4BTG2_9GAMM|nr:glucose-6-phosphate dehydrogenase [Methylovulum psychrotolerans]ASF44606.1 glucose-6-phosphate dehydrogenase [Methylovulum psychrotolerans]MBT9098694.1 glucose-6-phosphate dehydrogenase [Methylovulum psychrotolerans]